MARSNQSLDSNDPFLILITNHFPFGIGESFLENEFNILKSSFRKIFILSKNTEDTSVRSTSRTTEVIRFSKKSGPIDYILSLFLLLNHLPLSLRFLSEEVSYLRLTNRLTIRKFRKMIHDLLKALLISRQVKAIIAKALPGQPVLLYSYWLTSSALATLFVRSSNPIRRIARAHRVDLYEEAQPDRYLPYQQVMTRRLDCVYPVSDNGRRYLLSKPFNAPHNVQTAKLGTRDYGAGLQGMVSGRFILVSCSFIHTVKRVDRIISALQEVKTPIHWIHFGDGPLFTDVQNQANELLSTKENVSFEFRGKISNIELMEFYQRNKVDVFINTSLSEGIPVTMMEALSFSIPVIGMDVGGVREIVSDDHGRLLPADASAVQIAGAIDSVLGLPEHERINLRNNARRYWKENYNAERNYKNFIQSVKNLF